MSAPVIETVAKYFFFLTLNEQLTFAVGFRVLADLKAKDLLEKDEPAELIQVLHKWKTKLHQISPRDWSHFPDEAGFEWPKDFKMDAWKNFLGVGEADEVEALLLSRFLGFGDEHVADGLNVSVGTVRYRVGRGLRHLGGYLES